MKDIELLKRIAELKVCAVEDCNKKAKKKDKYCSMHRLRLVRSGAFYKPETMIEKLMEKVIPVPECGCWLWEGGVSDNGYGHIRTNNKYTSVHRASFELFNGEIPHGLDVCHKCDTPSCVNPNHLFLGTRKDNMRDARLKGRFARKLTFEKVMEIKSLIALGLSQRKVAKIFGVGQTAIGQISRKQTWRHVK